MMVLMMVAASTVFAVAPISQDVKISAVIGDNAAMTVNDVAKTGELSTSNVSAQTLADAGAYGATFYVNTRSNLGKGFTLSYTLAPLSGSTGNPDTINLVAKTQNGSADAVETDIKASKTVEILKTTSTTGMENHSVAINVKAASTTWKTDVRADSYSANMTFTFTANS